MEHSDLILSVPPEIVKLYFDRLDLKSSVMFATVCKTSCCKESIDEKETAAINKLLKDIVELAKEVHEVFTTKEGISKLLARMLRKLIFVSVSDINSSLESSASIEHCLEEYHALYEYVGEVMDIGITAFNDMLEDAQFEYRGFRIVGMNETKRLQLDTFKKLVEEKYFNKPFTVHSYISYGDMFVELNYHGVHVNLDIHKQKPSGGFNWMFLQDIVVDWVDACRKDILDNAGSNPLYSEFLTSDIKEINNMLAWTVCEGNSKAQGIMAKIIKSLLPYQVLFSGAKEAKIELWNDTVESCWLLADVVDEVQKHEMYSDRLQNITFDIQDDYSSALLL